MLLSPGIGAINLFIPYTLGKFLGRTIARRWKYVKYKHDNAISRPDAVFLFRKNNFLGRYIKRQVNTFTDTTIICVLTAGKINEPVITIHQSTN